MVAAVVILALSCVGLLGTTLVAWSRAVAMDKAKSAAEKDAEQTHRLLVLERDARKADFSSYVVERDHLKAELKKLREVRDASESVDDRAARLAGLLRPDPKPGA